jgi:hypothetical protein
MEQYNNYEERRHNDQLKEIQIAHFMDRLYETNGYGFKRVDNRQEQVNGIDVKLRGKDDRYRNVDEKAATARKDSYSTLKTYSFELSTMNNPGNKGWLLNEDSRTEDYALIYFQGEPDAIQKAEVIIVDKSDIIDKVHKKGISTVAGAEDKINEALDVIEANLVERMKKIDINSDKKNIRTIFDVHTADGKVQLFVNKGVDLKEKMRTYLRKNSKRFESMSDFEREEMYYDIARDITNDAEKVAVRYRDGTSLVCSYFLDEQPINFLIPKEELREMSRDIILYNGEELEKEKERDVEGETRGR